MPQRTVSTEKAPKAIGPYSQAVAAGDLIFTSGQIALDPKTQQMVEGDIRAQTERVMENLSAVLEGAGAGFENVVKATIFVVDLADFATVVEALVNDQVDIAHLGGFTYVQASKRAGVKPLVQRERDREFHSLFITQAGSPIRSLADLKKRSFAFGDVNSTSGHLMPEYFMRRNGVDPEVIAKAIYTGGHDATLLAVANGKVDAGALDEAVFQRMTSQGKIDPAKVRVFWTTPPFFDYVWVARKGLDARKADAVRDSFLALDRADPQRRAILEALSASKYAPAPDANSGSLREAALEAGLLK